MNGSHTLSALAMLQSDVVSVTANHEKYLIVFVGVVALSLLVNAIITLVMGITVMSALKEVKGVVADVHSKVNPILNKTNQLVDELSPKVRAATENVTQVTYTVRAKIDELGETVSQLNRTVNELNNRTRAQAAHVDRMVSSTLNTTEELTEKVVRGIRVPITQAAGLIAGLRTGAERLIQNFSQRGDSAKNKYDF